MADTFGLDGVDQVLAKLSQISYETSKKGGRRALRMAAQFIRDAAKENAATLNDPATGRAIADNVAELWNGRLNKTTGDLGFRVGVMQGAVLPGRGEKPSTSSGGPTPHWRLLEFGTEKMPAHPFMRRALSENIEAATSIFMHEFEKSLDRAIKKNARASRSAA